MQKCSTWNKSPLARREAPDADSVADAALGEGGEAIGWDVEAEHQQATVSFEQAAQNAAELMIDVERAHGNDVGPAIVLGWQVLGSSGEHISVGKRQESTRLSEKRALSFPGFHERQAKSRLRDREGDAGRPSTRPEIDKLKRFREIVK